MYKKLLFLALLKVVAFFAHSYFPSENSRSLKTQLSITQQRSTQFEKNFEIIPNFGIFELN